MQLIILVITWILTLSTFFIGYWLGSQKTDKPFAITLPKHIFKKKSILGAIPKLSVVEMEKRGTKLEATEKAIEETLDGIL